MVEGAVDFELHALRDLRRVALKLGVEVYAAVAVVFALETNRQPEILVQLLRAQVAVFLGNSLAVNRAVLHRPLLMSDGLPVRQILSVEQLHPLFIGKRRAIARRLRANQSGKGKAKHQSASSHGSSP